MCKTQVSHTNRARSIEGYSGGLDDIGASGIVLQCILDLFPVASWIFRSSTLGGSVEAVALDFLTAVNLTALTSFLAALMTVTVESS